MKPASTILGIESSCDDTAAAVYYNGKILSNITASQKIHEEYGGVIPELASRAHQSNIIPVIDQSLKLADCSLKNIDAIAVTAGPGLMGSLMVGLNTAKGLSLASNKPLVAVNHLQAHVAALFIDNDVQFPLLCLLVSGGHTQILWVTSNLEMKIIGQTIDDAAGEAFDKAGKLLGLGYPGGPQISKLASTGNPTRFQFPDPQIPGYNFSFSGIKTSLLYFLRDQSKIDPNFTNSNLNDICASYQQCIINQLSKRINKAIKELKPKSLGIAGGVSANALLRQSIKDISDKNKIACYIPNFEYCTDNAAMIAMAGALLFEAGKISPIQVKPYSRSDSF